MESVLKESLRGKRLGCVRKTGSRSAASDKPAVYYSSSSGNTAAIKSFNLHSKAASRSHTSLSTDRAHVSTAEGLGHGKTDLSLLS